MEALNHRGTTLAPKKVSREVKLVYDTNGHWQQVGSIIASTEPDQSMGSNKDIQYFYQSFECHTLAISDLVEVGNDRQSE